VAAPLSFQRSRASRICCSGVLSGLARRLYNFYGMRESQKHTGDMESAMPVRTVSL